MENSRDMSDIEEFREGGAEPDRLYSMQASDSQFDLRSIGVDSRDERQAMTSETQDKPSSGLFEEVLKAVHLSDEKKKRKIDSLLSAVSKDIHQIEVTTVLSAILPLLREIQQIVKQQIENLDRQNTSRGAPVPFGISLPNPASIPKACPEDFTDPQEQKNEPNNQEPVNTSKKRGYGKGNGTLPEDLEEVPVDSLSGPTVPLLIGIPATNVLSVGRGSHAEEALQKGRVQRKCDQCCCNIM